MILDKIHDCVEYIDQPTFDLCLRKLDNWFEYYTNLNVEPVLCLTENMQPTRDFYDYVYICRKYYSHLRNVLIYINDKFYFDVLKTAGFNNVYRVYGESKDYFHLGICRFINKFELLENNIEFKFQRLSNSRHDHN